MRLGLTALFVALFLAVIAGQNTLLQSTEAESNDKAITACAVQGSSCPQPSLDSSPGSNVILEHVVFSSGCHRSDLHVVRFVPASVSEDAPLVAQWCN